MKASIIITTYHRPEFLKRAISSCEAQKTDFEFEIIVVDDNGINTLAQLETAAVLNNYSNIKYYPLQKNSGACIARNKGAEISTGKYLFFLDDDDEYLKDKLQKQVDFLENNLEYDGCLAAFKRLDEKRAEIFSSANYPVVGNFKNFVLKGNFFTPMICIRKQSFVKSGGFIDISRFQDRFYMMNMLKNHFKFGILQDQLHIMYEHTADRITSKSISRTKLAIDQIVNWLEKYRDDFTEKEWTLIKVKQLRQLAVSYYNSINSTEKRYSSVIYWKIFKKSFLFSDFLMIIKSLVK